MPQMFIEAPHGARSNRARRMFDALLRGAAPDAIAEEENLPDTVVETILAEELGRRRTTPLADFGKIQIARLNRLFLAICDRAHRGESKAVDRALKIIDRLDRYHGFTRATPAASADGEDAREKLYAKIDAIVARLDMDQAEA